MVYAAWAVLDIDRAGRKTETSCSAALSEVTVGTNGELKGGGAGDGVNVLSTGAAAGDVGASADEGGCGGGTGFTRTSEAAAGTSTGASGGSVCFGEEVAELCASWACGEEIADACAGSCEAVESPLAALAL